MTARFAETLRKRLVDCGMPEPLWWKVPVDVRHRFYRGENCLVIKRLGNGLAVSNFITPRLPDQVFSNPK